MEPTQEVQIDTDLYSRQIGTFGLETMGKLIKMNVVIVGCRGLGCEIAKNLILAGPASVQICDPDMVRIEDLGANFYLEEKHVGKVSRADASVEKLCQLNPYVKVTSLPFDQLEATAANASTHVVCQTEILLNGKFCDPDTLNKLCRQHNSGYIFNTTPGAFGVAFLDYGEKHTVTDHNGENTAQFVVTFIEKGEKTTVQVHEDKRHSYEEGDYVVLTEVEGMTEINELAPAKILSTKSHSFTLELDSTKFSDYKRQGTVENKKVPKEVSYHSWEQSFPNPVASSEFGFLNTTDFGKFGRPDQLHVGIAAILKFVAANNRYPTAADADACVDLAKAWIEGAELKPELEEDVVKKAVSFSQCSISPLAAFFGGIIAQEIVKYTGKYTPLHQWLHHDIFEGLPRAEVNREPEGGRYDDQIRIYGRKVQEDLKKVNLFMIGAGALGCELIKAFAVMGIGCGAGGKVTCTDNDNIEVSNLNRQFLFRQANVGHSKSGTACAIAKTMNPALNVTDYQKFVSPDTEDFFNDEFWESLDFIVNAVDNIKARLYVDRRCVWFEKPLFESGTLGTKANSQMVMPHKTQCYGDSQDPAEESIPMCTLRNFPNLIEHCIEWGRDKFNGMFVDGPSDLVSYLDNPKVFVGRMQSTETTTTMINTLEKCVQLIGLNKTQSFQACVDLSVSQFNDMFDYSIRDLLFTFPLDAKDKEGNPFWSGPKRAPSAIAFDSKNPTHMNYVLPFANLIALACGIPENRDLTQVTEMAAAAKVAPYVAKKAIVKLPEEEKEEAKQAPVEAPPATEEDNEIIARLQKELEALTATTSKDKFSPIEFEKDDDKNLHIDFINATANLRASNYSIKNCDRNKTKMIAGKIIPAIATTTAMITGVVTAEIFKVVQGYCEIEDLKNSFINLGISAYQFSEPMPVSKITSKEYDPIVMGPVKTIPEEGYTIFDKVTVDKGSLTVQQFLDFLAEEYKIEVQLIAAGDYSIYNMWLPNNKHAPRLTKKLEDIFVEIDGKPLPEHQKYMIIVLGGALKDSGDDFNMPPIKYVFRK